MKRTHDIEATRTRTLTRRGFFDDIGNGLHGVALATLLSRDLYGAPAAKGESYTGRRRSYDLKPRSPHFGPKAKSVIQLFMHGGPSQVDLFDPKPMLDKHDGEPYFDQVAADLTVPEQAGGLMRSPFQFGRHGQSGMWVSEVMPHFARQVDNVAMVRSMFTAHPNHEPALFMIHSGRIIPGRPTIGSWVVYGLGSENQSLPAYVVLDDPLGLPVNGVQNWQAGFLPPLFQGTRIRRSTGSPILNLHSEVEEPLAAVEIGRDLLARLDRIHKRDRPGRLQLDARMAGYELAARLQLEATDALDLAKESPKTLEAYGVGKEPTDSYARRCLMARRLVERGVRYVQIFINGQIWDNHDRLEDNLRKACARIDQPVAALLEDLKQRGLLEETLVIWGGEFGRLPIAQLAEKSAVGRDHNPNAFTSWLAGAGVKAGTVLGTTDELGYKAVEERVSVADWHATILHLLGLDYEQLVFEQNGLKEKLTSVFEARVVREILT